SASSSRQPRSMNLGKDILQRFGNVPTGIMSLHFGQVADVTDVVALAVPVDVFPDHFLARHLFGKSERLKDRTTVAATTAEVVNLTAARRFDETLDETHDISGMDVVTNLLALVAINRILASLYIALNQVAKEPVQFDAGMIRPGETPAAQTASHHAEIAPILLHHDVGSNLRCAEQRVLRSINPHRLAYTVVIFRASILPSCFGLDERQLVGRVAVNLVCGHMDKRRSRHNPVRRLQEVDRTYGVRIKVLERYLRGQIMTRLRCTVHNSRRTQLIY